MNIAALLLFITNELTWTGMVRRREEEAEERRRPPAWSEERCRG